jgi:hypothetical protein
MPNQETLIETEQTEVTDQDSMLVDLASQSEPEQNTNHPNLESK